MSKIKVGKRGYYYLTSRDTQILKFLWNWKLASTATIHEALCRPNSPYSTYKKLERLEKQNFITTAESFEYNFLCWQLSDKGFGAIRESLGDLKEEGYLSENLWHDRNVLAFQLGEWMLHDFPFVTHYTEQQLRRRGEDYYPSWLPHLSGHRSDGYTHISVNGKETVLAYEVELWPKNTARYESIIKFYDSARKFERVFWLVGDPMVKDEIIRAKTCAKDKSLNYHVFVDLVDYIERGWDAAVTNERSQKLFTIRGNFQQTLGEPYSELMANPWGESRVTVHYNKRKVIGKKHT